jgi:hypothetical protein
MELGAQNEALATGPLDDSKSGIETTFSFARLAHSSLS